MLRNLFLATFLVAFSGVSWAQPPKANEVNSTQCRLPHAQFKYVYMDSAISIMKKPSIDILINTASDHMDTVKAQYYLWYVYRHPKLSDSFFQRVNIVVLAARNDDAITSILWLMSRSDKYFSKLQPATRSRLISHLEKWKNSYDKNAPEGAQVLQLYSDQRKTVDSLYKSSRKYSGDDVDLMIQKGIRSEVEGKKLEALYFYTKVAEFGYSKGLIGASLLLPQLGGDACVSRAAYYMRLSGVLAPASWLEREPKGS